MWKVGTFLGWDDHRSLTAYHAGSPPRGLKASHPYLMSELGSSFLPFPAYVQTHLLTTRSTYNIVTSLNLGLITTTQPAAVRPSNCGVPTKANVFDELSHNFDVLDDQQIGPS